MMLRSLGRVAVVGLLVAASTVTARAADTTVEMLSNNVFSPENITVSVGDTVTWVNLDSVVHDAVARDPAVSWNTGFVEPNAEAAVTFNSVATYIYHCRIHPGMTGHVTVELAPPATDTVETVVTPPDSGAPLAMLAAALLVVFAIVRRTGSRRVEAQSATGGPSQHL